MGAKSRGNWRVEWCSEVECENRDKLCHSCIARSALKKRSMGSTSRLNPKTHTNACLFDATSGNGSKV
jgi:hypothetical protein